MAVLSVRNPTLLDFKNALDPDNRVGVVIEILNETNEMLREMSWKEGNLTTGNRTIIRAGLPEPTWRKMYGGVQPNKGSTVQVTDNTGMLEAYAEIDVALANLGGNAAAFRLIEDRAHIEGMNQEMQETLIFGNEDTEAEAFTGLAPRFNSLTAENGDNIIDAGGTGTDNSSIWLVVWGDMTVHGIFPKGSEAGLQVMDLGEKMIQDASDGSNTGRMQAFVTHYKWAAGLTVKDWRFVVRICNIDKSLLTADASTGADLPDLMFQAMELIPNMSMGRASFYMSRTNRTFVRRQLSNARSMSTLTTSDVGGTRVDAFQGVPMARVDALAADEARVT